MIIKWIKNKLKDFNDYCIEQDAIEGDIHLMTQEQWDEDQAERKKYFDDVENRYWEQLVNETKRLP